MTIDVNELDLCESILEPPNISYANTLLSGVPEGSDVINTTYAGWCIDLIGAIQQGGTYRVDLYSSLDADLPDFLLEIPWNGINFILNNKEGSWLDVQAAIWKLVEGYFPGDFPFGQHGASGGCPASGEPVPDLDKVNAMVEGAIRAEEVGFTPAPGDTFAIILVPLENDGCTPETGVQLTIIEFQCPSEDSEGCTPGYWKACQHFGSWPALYEPSTPFDSVFDDAFPEKSLLQVLKMEGGGLNALGRHTVAALLNAASPEVDYGLSVDEVVSLFNDVFPGTNEEYEHLKDIFESLNEQLWPLGRPGPDRPWYKRWRGGWRKWKCRKPHPRWPCKFKGHCFCQKH